MGKVRCKFCKFEQQRKCMKKSHASVALNKKRVCNIYSIDVEKADEWALKQQQGLKPKVTFRPDGLWSREARRKERKEFEEEQIKQYESTIEQQSQVGSKHPSTGDLSRFLTTQETPQPPKSNRVKTG